MAAIVTSTQTIPCAFVKGVALPQAERVQTFGITGVDGVGVHLLGLFGSPSSFQVSQYGNIAFLESWFDQLHSNHGSIVVVENDEGVLYPNQLIESVTQPSKRTSINLKGATEFWAVQLRTRTV